MTSPQQAKGPRPASFETVTHPQTLADQNGKKIEAGSEHDEHSKEHDVQNLMYADDDREPEIHFRTWIAVLAMCVLDYVQLVALTGPPTILSSIAQDLDGESAKTWVPNSVVLAQAVFASILSSSSDLFQARKTLLVGATVIAFIGSAIASGSKSIGRLIAAQTLIGAGLAVIPLTFTVPSEILPRKWRPMAQAAINSGAALGSTTAPLIIGALAKHNPSGGWRTFYWIQTGLWGASGILLFLGYRPPKRHTRLDHLSFFQKLGHLDLAGCGLLAIGLCLLLTGLGLGGNQYSWTNSRTLATLIIGIVFLIAFELYEWKGTKTGILHHELFRQSKASRTFALCLPIAFVEGLVAYSYAIFCPILTAAIFEPDPFLLSARVISFWIACLVGTILFGYMATKIKSVREPLFLGYLTNLGGIIGFATIQPGQNVNPIIFGALEGFGFGAILSQVIACVQITAPHAYLATATAVAVTIRAIGSIVFTSIYSAAVQNRLDDYIPSYLAEAAAATGLPVNSLSAFVEALASNQPDKLAAIPGVSPSIIAAGVHALKQAYADGLRVVPIIAAPFGALACVLCLFLTDLRKLMNYHVDAPVEELHAKGEKAHGVSQTA